MIWYDKVYCLYIHKINGLVNFGARATHIVAKSLNTQSQRVYTDSMVIVSRIVAVHSDATNFEEDSFLLWHSDYGSCQHSQAQQKDNLCIVDFSVNNFGVALERETNLRYGSSRNGRKIYMPTAVPNHWIDSIIF